MDEMELRSPTPDAPLYSNARNFLRIVDGVPYIVFRNMMEIIWEQRGNPQAQEDWTNPDEWIPQRLGGYEHNLALRLWNESNRELNPRHAYHLWQFSGRRHNLLGTDNNGVLYITEQGHSFLQEEGQLVAEIDNYEGVLTVLQLVAERGPGKRRDILPEYAEFCRTYTTHRSENVIKGALYTRLLNLIERRHITRNGQTYEVTDAGLSYLNVYRHLVPGRIIGDNQSQLLRLANDLSKDARTQLDNYLHSMNPFKFEELIKLLLEEMGYINVEATTPSNDKGVDVVADIELGISQVREVIQVKRYKGNIDRPVLDGLRGSLHRFKAVRGTIITTGGFSKGTKLAAFEVGAAPITLIDGDKLLDLMVEYNVGVAKKSVEYIEFEPSRLGRVCKLTEQA